MPTTMPPRRTLRPGRSRSAKSINAATSRSGRCQLPKYRPPKYRHRCPGCWSSGSACPPQPKGCTPTSATEDTDHQDAENGTSPFRPSEPPIDAEVTDTDVIIRFADRRYRVRGLDKNHSLDRLKINLLVSRDDLLHVDTLDLYAARSRNAFIKQASAEIYIEEETIKRDLAKILLKLEDLQEKQIQERLSVKDRKTGRP